MRLNFFQSIFIQNLRGKPDCLLVLFNMLANHRHGVDNRSINIISEETGIPEQRILIALEELASGKWPWIESVTGQSAWYIRCADGFDAELRAHDNRIRQTRYRANHSKPVKPAVIIPLPIEQPAKPKWKKPTIDELKVMMAKAGLPVEEAERFFNHHESKGWMIGKNPMKSTEHAVGTWRLNYEERQRHTPVRTSIASAGQSNATQRINRTAGTANAGTELFYKGLGSISVPDREEPPTIPGAG